MSTAQNVSILCNTPTTRSIYNSPASLATPSLLSPSSRSRSSSFNSDCLSVSSCTSTATTNSPTTPPSTLHMSRHSSPRANTLLPWHLANKVLNDDLLAVIPTHPLVLSKSPVDRKRHFTRSPLTKAVLNAWRDCRVKQHHSYDTPLKQLGEPAWIPLAAQSKQRTMYIQEEMMECTKQIMF